MNLRKYLRDRKLFFQFAGILMAVTIFATCSFFYFLLLIEQSSGKGSAINVSGSLRMQTYVMALEVAQSVNESEQYRRKSINEALNEFERRLLSPNLTVGIPEDTDDPLRKSYNQIYAAFYHIVKPMALQVIEKPDLSYVMLDFVPGFVDNIDRFVGELEQTLEVRTRWMKIGLITTIFLSFVIGFILLIYFRRAVFKPLKELADVASQIRQGNFEARSEYRRQNEIGVLASSFNYMIEDLAHMYRSLEDQVREKTADLDEQNRNIQTLFKLRSIFTQSDELSKKTLLTGLQIVADYFAASKVFLVLIKNSESVGFVAGTYPDNTAKTDQDDLEICNRLFSNCDLQVINTAQDDTCRYLMIPSLSRSQTLGSLVICIPNETYRITPPELLQTFGEIFATALENASKKEAGYRLAVFEERSTIARELHDSIAQSLAYSRIQLTRLSMAIKQEHAQDQLEEIVNDLKTGVSTAYSQLREVLTTFRLKPSSSDISQNIRQVLETFHERSGIQFTLQNKLFGFEINANKQIHMLQIIREALTNVEKHSRATLVNVTIDHIQDNQIELVIADNGKGFDGDIKEKTGHFGLSIMEERARVLGGQLKIAHNTPSGVIISLKFQVDHEK